MRSDREEWPEGYTKEQADQAEIGEALLIAKQRTSRAAVTCQRYWPTSFDVCGAIRDKYNSLGGVSSFLWLPTSGNIVNPGGAGERVTFVNGPIYWSAAGGAHPVVNSFLNRWGNLGYEGGWLAYPTTDEVLLPDGGRRQEFQGGAVYVAFQNAIGSAIRNGPIRDKWNTIGGNAPGGSPLGYITGDEIGIPDGQGRMARFERGVIYWHPTHGAHPVTGLFLERWASQGYERSRYGYPTSDEIRDEFEPGNITQYFQTNKMRLELATPAAGQHTKTFQPQDPNYIKKDRYATFSGQVSYNFDPEIENGKYFYPMAWGQQLNESAQALGGSNLMDCKSYLNKFGQIQQYSDSHMQVPINYFWHSTIPKNTIGAQYDLFGYCSFETLSGDYTYYQFSFAYQVLDYNLPPPTGGRSAEGPGVDAFESDLTTE
ncbi:hypothetical protein HQ308_20080 [Rhodococcus sp. BP-241]|nr:hypothetical protein [Rhodococcus sp. BP-241]